MSSHRPTLSWLPQVFQATMRNTSPSPSSGSRTDGMQTRPWHPRCRPRTWTTKRRSTMATVSSAKEPRPHICPLVRADIVALVSSLRICSCRPSQRLLCGCSGSATLMDRRARFPAPTTHRYSPRRSSLQRSAGSSGRRHRHLSFDFH